MKTRIVDWLLGITIGIVLILLVQPKKVDYTELLKEKDRIHKHRIDSINAIVNKYEKQQLILLKEIELLQIQKSKASAETQRYKHLYEKAKNTPVQRLSVNTIDSLLSKWYK